MTSEIGTSAPGDFFCISIQTFSSEFLTFFDDVKASSLVFQIYINMVSRHCGVQHVSLYGGASLRPKFLCSY